MNPLLIYHRGRHGALPSGETVEENSLIAFERAIAEGAKMIEFDVWNNLEIAHDPTPQNSSLRLPEVLSFIRGRCSVNIEIKSPLAATDAFSCIEAALSGGEWLTDQFVISAFHHETAIKAKKRFPTIQVGVINDGVLLSSYIESLRAEGIDNLHLHWANIYMDIDFGYMMRETLRKNGMSIWVWTVNTTAVYETVTEYGVDAVFTDSPNLLR